jgi:hypothetical protein
MILAALNAYFVKPGQASLQTKPFGRSDLKNNNPTKNKLLA